MSYMLETVQIRDKPEWFNLHSPYVVNETLEWSTLVQLFINKA